MMEEIPPPEEIQPPGQIQEQESSSKREPPPTNKREEDLKPSNFFQKAQLSPSIVFVAILTCSTYFWLYMFIGPACLSSIIVAISFVLAFSIVCYLVP